jgi:aspartyl-tRNA synthetase
MAMLCGASSIRDVIAFPKSATGRDLLVNAPSSVTQDQLNEYGIKLSSSEIKDPPAITTLTPRKE